MKRIVLAALAAGWLATDALLDFGPGVLPGAAALAVSLEATPQEANGALWVLLDGQIGRAHV